MKPRTLRKFRITHTQAVWEKSSWLVEADSEEVAPERFDAGEAELDWKEITDTVEGIDSECAVEEEEWNASF